MIEALVALGVVAGVGALAAGWVRRRAQRAHVIETQTAWVRAGQRVLFGPVGAVSFGVPAHTYSRGYFGALGIVDGRLVFEGYRDHRVDASVALESIVRVGLCTIPLEPGGARYRAVNATTRALHVHYMGPEQWRVATFSMDDPQAVAAALHHGTGLPVYDSGAARDDFGPMDATQMAQDVYGEWSVLRDGALYLAPDRVLFNWRDAILLSAIQRIDVLKQGTWRDRLPHAEGLLRIEYTTAEGAFEVAGFVVRKAEAWAGAIQQAMREPVPIQSGRKKKER